MSKTRRIALLRGINVGAAKRISMADLKALFEKLGHEDVKTLLNSGNVVFTSGNKTAEADAAGIEAPLSKKLGSTTRVTILDGKALAAALAQNPLATAGRDPARLQLLVLRNEAAAAKLKDVLKQRWAPEEIALKRGVAYLWCPNGVLKGKVWTAVDRLLAGDGTARNLATMTKLAALAES